MLAGWHYALLAAAYIAVAGNLRFPLFAKPLAEGTGKGVGAMSRIDSPAALTLVMA